MGLLPLPGGDALRWLAVLASGAGLLLRIAAMARLRNRFSPLVAIQEDHTLETHGVYHWIRHPGYTGAWLASTGGALAFGSASAIVPALLFGVLLMMRARREESVLERRFGEEFRAYRARTGAFWPALRLRTTA